METFPTILYSLPKRISQWKDLPRCTISLTYLGVLVCREPTSLRYVIRQCMDVEYLLHWFVAICILLSGGFIQLLRIPLYLLLCFVTALTSPTSLLFKDTIDGVSYVFSSWRVCHFPPNIRQRHNDVQATIVFFLTSFKRHCSKSRAHLTKYVHQCD